MLNESRLLIGSAFTISLAASALVVLPYAQMDTVHAPQGLKPYTEQQLRGRQVYIENGCIACHSQQPRTRAQAPDFQRGWGRAPVAADYYYDQPVLLGTMRTGPDLFNIGARQPSEDWQLGHLYQPRAYVPGSIMPSFPYLFEVKPADQVEAGEVKVQLPADQIPVGKVIVARPAALDLVRYLQSLNRSYPALPITDIAGVQP